MGRFGKYFPMNIGILKFSTTSPKAAFFPVILMVFCSGTAIALQLIAYKDNLERSIIASQEALVASYATNIDQQLFTLKNSLSASSLAVTRNDISSSERAQIFLDVNAGMNAIFERSTFLFSNTGDLIAERPFLPGRQGQNFVWRDYIRDSIASRSTVISKPFITTKDDHAAVIMLAAPVFENNDQKNIIAVMAGSIGLSEPKLLGNILDTKIGDTGHMYIFDPSNGLMVLHKDKKNDIKSRLPT